MKKKIMRIPTLLIRIFFVLFLFINPLILPAQLSTKVVTEDNQEAIAAELMYLYPNEIQISYDELLHFITDVSYDPFDEQIGYPRASTVMMDNEIIQFTWEEVSNAEEYVVRSLNLETGEKRLNFTDVTDHIIDNIDNGVYLFLFQATTVDKGSAQFIIIEDKPIFGEDIRDCNCPNEEFMTTTNFVGSPDQNEALIIPWNEIIYDQLYKIQIDAIAPSSEDTIYFKPKEITPSIIMIGVPSICSNNSYADGAVFVNTGLPSSLPYLKITFGYNGIRLHSLGESEGSLELFGCPPYRNQNPGDNSIHKASKLDLNILPNPAYSEATLSYELPVNGKVDMIMINRLGQEFIILSKEQSKGFHQQKLDLSQFPSGLYFLKIQSGKHTKYKSILVTK